MTDKTMSNKKGETVISKRLHRKQKIEDHEYTKTRKWNQEYQDVQIAIVYIIRARTSINRWSKSLSLFFRLNSTQMYSWKSMSMFIGEYFTHESIYNIIPLPASVLHKFKVNISYPSNTRRNFGWFRTFIIPRPYYDSSHWNYFRKSSMKEVLK